MRSIRICNLEPYDSQCVLALNSLISRNVCCYFICCAIPLHVHRFGHYSILDIVSVVIFKGSIKKKDCKEFYIHEETKNSLSYKNLFDFIVVCINEFKRNRKIEKQLPIGFTFPFPMRHESLTCGKLIRWTRDFEATGAEGRDVVQLLKEAASKKGVSVQQTTATLRSRNPTKNCGGGRGCIQGYLAKI